MVSPLMSRSDYALRHDSDIWAVLAVGGVLMTFGAVRLLSPEELPVLSWLNLALGACIVSSPWLLRFASNEPLMRAGVALGGMIMLLAALSARLTLLMHQRLCGRRTNGYP